MEDSYLNKFLIGNLITYKLAFVQQSTWKALRGKRLIVAVRSKRNTRSMPSPIRKQRFECITNSYRREYATKKRRLETWTTINYTYTRKSWVMKYTACHLNYYCWYIHYLIENLSPFLSNFTWNYFLLCLWLKLSGFPHRLVTMWAQIWHFQQTVHRENGGGCYATEQVCQIVSPFVKVATATPHPYVLRATRNIGAEGNA